MKLRCQKETTTLLVYTSGTINNFLQK